MNMFRFLADSFPQQKQSVRVSLYTCEAESKDPLPTQTDNLDRQSTS